MITDVEIAHAIVMACREYQADKIGAGILIRDIRKAIRLYDEQATEVVTAVPTLDVSKPCEHIDGTPLVFERTDLSGDHFFSRADRLNFTVSQYPGSIGRLIVVNDEGRFWICDAETGDDAVIVRNVAEKDA